MDWTEDRLHAVALEAAPCPDPCSADVISLVAEVRRLQRLLDRAYPWLHNPYTPRQDARLCAQFDTMKREIEVVISHLAEIDEDSERVTSPCASCDGTGKIETVVDGEAEQVICPNCAPISAEG